MKVVVAALRPSYFNGSGLAAAIKKFCNADVTFLTCYPKDSSLDYDWGLLRQTYLYIFDVSESIKAIEESDLLIVCGMGFIWHLLKGPERDTRHYEDLFPAIEKVRRIIAISDAGIFMKIWDKYLMRYEQVFAMPSLYPYLDRCLSPKPLFHTNWIFSSPRKVNKKIVIGHSPGIKKDGDRKGTKAIKEVVESLGYELQILEGLPHDDCVRAKAKMDIFIEQFPNPYIDKNRATFKYNMSPYYGSLGKSGQEGMCMGCATITSGIFADTTKYFPFPPVIIANTKRQLRTKLIKLLYNRKYLEDTRRIQNDWAKKYLHPSFVANYIMKDYL